MFGIVTKSDLVWLDAAVTYLQKKVVYLEGAQKIQLDNETDIFRIDTKEDINILTVRLSRQGKSFQEKLDADHKFQKKLIVAAEERLTTKLKQAEDMRRLAEISYNNRITQLEKALAGGLVELSAELDKKETLREATKTLPITVYKPERPDFVDGDAIKAIVGLLDQARCDRLDKKPKSDDIYEDGIIEGLRLALEICVREA